MERHIKSSGFFLIVFLFSFFSLFEIVLETILYVLKITTTTKNTAAISGLQPNEDNRRKRRKVSIEHECPLPSPPDLKISDYEPLRKTTTSKLPLIEDNIKQPFSIIHDLNDYMFKIELDKKGNTGI